MTFLEGGDRNNVRMDGPASFAEMHIEGGAGIGIQSVNEWHAVEGFVNDTLERITFNAGDTAAITVIANAGGGKITVTSPGHTLSNGDIITIVGTTNYNDIYVVSNVAAGTFEVVSAFGISEVGDWIMGSNFVIQDAGVYLFGWQISASAGGNNKIYSFTLSINDAIEPDGRQERKFAIQNDIGAVAGSFLITAAVGDIIAFNVRPDTDATELTITQATTNIIRVG